MELNSENEHYERGDLFIKYTINLPRNVWFDFCNVTSKHTIWGGRKSTFARKALIDAIAEEYGKGLGHIEVKNPRKKYHGFLSNPIGIFSKKT